MILIAFANATLRELLLNQYFLPQHSHQINILSLGLSCSLYIWLIYPFLHIHKGRQALWIGLLWTVLTVMFEFGLGFFVGKTWQQLVAQYNVASGQIWPLFLVVLFTMPYIVYTLKKRTHNSTKFNKSISVNE
jgi:hypothetical protein